MSYLRHIAQKNPNTASQRAMLVAYGLRPVGNDSKHEIDFGRLRARVREKPRTKAGQVRQAWPEIRDLIAAGHSLKDIWAWLNESGISIGYARLSHYIGQLRRKEKEGGRPGRAVDSDDAALQTNAAACRTDQRPTHWQTCASAKRRGQGSATIPSPTSAN